MENYKVFSPCEEKNFFGDVDDGTECILKFIHCIKFNTLVEWLIHQAYWTSQDGLTVMLNIFVCDLCFLLGLCQYGPLPEQESASITVATAHSVAEMNRMLCFNP